MYIIAEIGYNHQGDVKIAKDLIDAAIDSGADCVKFQKTDLDSKPIWKNQLYNSENSFGKTYYDHRKYLEFGIEELLELETYCGEDADFLCSAKDFESAILLSKHFQKIKLPSQMLRDEKTFNLLHSKGKYVYASTGMWTEYEVESAPWFEFADVVLHCVSVYPADPEVVNLKMIQRYKCKRKGKKVGYSSHEIDALAVPYAVAAGAEVIERHFTLDHSMKGSDHATVSSTPDEFEKMVWHIRQVEEYMGSGKKFLTANEVDVRERWVGYGLYNS